MSDNMIKEPFERKHEEKDEYSKVFTIRLNQEEQEKIKQMMVLLSQPKFTTAMKQTLEIGATVLQTEQTGKIMDIVFKNKQRNRRTGVEDVANLL